MSSNPYAPGGPPTGLPPELVQSLVNRLITPAQQYPMPGTQPGGPVGAPPAGPTPGPPAGPPAGPPPAGPPAGGGAAPPQGDGGEKPQGPPKDEKDGLDDEQANALKELMSDPKTREQIQKIARMVSKEKRGQSEIELDPVRRLQLAQGWNARVGELAAQMNAARSQNPGASKASDEALLRIYYMTPIAEWSPKDTPFPIPLEDIDEYADEVRLHLVKSGWTDMDKIEDQTTRECFPLREPLISAGRTWDQRVDFVDQMLLLTERWLKEYGRLPIPDLQVLKATSAGKGDPESQTRDSDSSAYPPGGYRNPPKPRSKPSGAARMRGQIPSDAFPE